MQRHLLEALAEISSAESAPPLAWFGRRALGFREESQTRSSISRAAVGLQRAGLLERGLVAHRSAPSKNSYYRHARSPLHPDDANDLWLQGERMHSVLRLTPSDEGRIELQSALARWGDMPRNGRLFQSYATWLFAPGPWIWPDDAGVILLPSSGSLSEYRLAVSDHALIRP